MRIGGDLRFSTDKVLAARNFANKIWNAARFVLMNTGDKVLPIDENRLDIADKWMLSRLADMTEDITSLIDKFELGLAAQKLHDFLWSELCDWYIEMAKPRLTGEDEADKQTAISMLNHALVVTMKLLHPFMPFITEEIYQSLPGTEGSIMVSPWPVPGKRYETEEKMMGNVMEVIRGIRNIRAEMNVPAGKKVPVRILAAPEAKADYEMCAKYIERLGMASSVEFIEDKSAVPEKAVSVIGVGAEAFMALGDLIDIEKELARLDAEVARLENEVKRVEGKLNNPGFIAKAPEKVVQDERDKLAKYTEMLDAVRRRRAELSK